jgi:hypothetical protein
VLLSQTMYTYAALEYGTFNRSTVLLRQAIYGSEGHETQNTILWNDRVALERQI